MSRRSIMLCALMLTVGASPLAAATAPPRPAHGPWGVDLADQDPTVRPGDDFAMYQNGGWFGRTQIGSGQPNAAYWRDVRIEAGQRIDAMLNDLDALPAGERLGSKALVSAFRRSAMDEATIAARGITPLAPELAAIGAASDKSRFAALMGSVEGPGTLRQIAVRLNPGRDLFTLQIDQDQSDPECYALYIGQGGLILPGPEYYVDPSFRDLKSAYQAHIATMLRLIGWPDAVERAGQIVDLETRIAMVSSSHEQVREVSDNYHRVTIKQLRNLAPGFDWNAFLGGAGLPRDVITVIDSPAAINGIAKIYASAPIEVLQAKQAFGAAYVNAARLSPIVYDAYRQFAASALAGLQAGPNRKSDAINVIESAVPDAVGAIYVERFFSPEVKAKVSNMSALMKQALNHRISQTDWLSAEGKARARQKLGSLQVHVGYPDNFDDYRGLMIKDNDFYGNASRAAAYDWRKQVRELKQKYDRSAWRLTPFYPQYNYTPTANTVEMPAALLVPPFFDINADDAVNYGADGTTIGSQIAAAFSGIGINYDATGRLRQWLPPADASRLSDIRRKLSARYSQQEPLPGMHLKGDLLADEAMSDIDGVQIALDAYHASLGGIDAPLIDGYTGDQRFFLGRAQMWRAKFSPEFTRNQIATGSNAPPYMRINGPLANIDAWYDAFKVASGDKLYVPPEDRIRAWATNP